ncbi:uncharacterized protein LOC114518588 [Dendronephthya gigantea]|uniref:uncharacterized protein LOC114518588 n=1 Tax=Dendronephthya gigantea TaxID=151771 RepID=UPI00106AFCEE|nr:uncharacterized protein LOC114518588 [Dendronephthya gigantea]
MSSNIKEQISKCDMCASFKPQQQREPLISHQVPDRPWAKIAIDLFQYQNKDYLVTVDYYSNFFEIHRVYSSTSSTIIKKVKSHIARYGIPEELVSDNGPQFISQEFQSFAKDYGFRHTQTSPHHHQSNGKVEAAVKQAKKAVRVAQTSNGDFYLALLSIRNTPQEGMASSPAQRLMSRRTKTTLPSMTNLLEPRVITGVQNRIQTQQKRQQRYYNKGTRMLEPLREGDTVKMQPVQLGQKKWATGKVVKNVGICSYKVVADSTTYIRNRKYLRKVGVEDSAQDEPLTAPNEEHEQAAIEPEQHHEETVETQTPTIDQIPDAATDVTSQALTTRRSRRVITRPKRLNDYVIY